MDLLNGFILELPIPQQKQQSSSTYLITASLTRYLTMA
jgi:hypothetical protein